MSIVQNVQTVKDFFAAINRGDREALSALVADDIEWVIPGRDWPLAGTYRGHAELADLLETASGALETSTEPREFVAQGDRVLVVGVASGKVKATNKAFVDEWVFAITVRSGKLTASANMSIPRPWRGRPNQTRLRQPRPTSAPKPRKEPRNSHKSPARGTAPDLVCRAVVTRPTITENFKCTIKPSCPS